MDKRIKIALAAGIVLAGLAVAMIFRRAGGERPPVAAERLAVNGTAERAEPAPPPAVPGPVEVVAARAVPPPAPPQSLEPPRQPPQLAREYPGGFGRGPAPLAEVPGPFERRGPATHRVVDGDTLAKLAERYLGSPTRAMDIFEANRSVLISPELLPIGVELQLPAGGK
jgi:nucleoid-associated protein YgaU